MRRVACAAAAGALTLGLVTALAPGVARAITAPWPKTQFQLGFDSYVTYHCEPLRTYEHWAVTEMKQFAALGANAVAFAFPLYSPGITSDEVFGALDCSGQTFQTPPVPLLRQLIRIAHHQGLQVMLRPLVVLVREAPGTWRGDLDPEDLTTWYESYEEALRPYLELAQATHVEHFALASELDSVSGQPGFGDVVAYARSIYTHDLQVTYSWFTADVKRPWPDTSEGVDTYPRLYGAGLNLTPVELLSMWDHLLTSDPGYELSDLSDETINEVGIVAENGAYHRPLSVTRQPFNQTVQANWYTTACLFMWQHQMRGIYYWGQWMASYRGNLLFRPSPGQPLLIQPEAQQAIRACFEWAGGRPT